MQNLDLLYSNSMCRASSMPTSIFIEQFVLECGDTVRTASGSSLTISLNHLTTVTRKKYLTKIIHLQRNNDKLRHMKMKKNRLLIARVLHGLEKNM